MEANIEEMRRDLRRAYELLGRKVMNVTVDRTESSSVLLDPVRELYERTVCLVTVEALTEGES